MAYAIVNNGQYWQPLSNGVFYDTLEECVAHIATHGGCLAVMGEYGPHWVPKPVKGDLLARFNALAAAYTAPPATPFTNGEGLEWAGDFYGGKE